MNLATQSSEFSPIHDSLHKMKYMASNGKHKLGNKLNVQLFLIAKMLQFETYGFMKHPLDWIHNEYCENWDTFLNHWSVVASQFLQTWADYWHQLKLPVGFRVLISLHFGVDDKICSPLDCVLARSGLRDRNHR